MNLRRTQPVIVKEFRQIRRDRRTLGVLIFIPAFMLVMFGYALDMDVSHLPTVVYDADHSAESRALIDQFFQKGHSEYFDLRHIVDDPKAIDPLMLSGQVKVGVIIPHNFSETLSAGRTADVQVLVDGVNASEAAAAVGYIDALVRQYGFDVQEAQTGQRPTRLLPIDYHPRVWYNPQLESVFFLLPGLIAFILMIITVVATSLSVVREREMGSMEQMVVSPLHPFELILGKLIPYALISLISTGLILVASFVLFAMPFKGSFFLLFVATLIFLCGALGMGLVISTVVRTQETAFFLAVMSTLLPTFVLSGFVFPISNMPGVIQAITYLVPARYFLVILRDIMLKGVGIEAFWEQLLLLVAFGVLMLSVGTVRLKKIMG